MKKVTAAFILIAAISSQAQTIDVTRFTKAAPLTRFDLNLAHEIPPFVNAMVSVNSVSQKARLLFYAVCSTDAECPPVYEVEFYNVKKSKTATCNARRYTSVKNLQTSGGPKVTLEIVDLTDGNTCEVTGTVVNTTTVTLTSEQINSSGGTTILISRAFGLKLKRPGQN